METGIMKKILILMAIAVALTAQVSLKERGEEVYENGALSNSDVQVVAGHFKVTGWYIYNPASTVCYLQLHNALASAVTPGTTAAKLNIGVPTASGANVHLGDLGLDFDTAITVVQATAVDGGTNCDASMDLNLFYK